MESTLTHEVFGQVRVLLAEGNRLFLGKDVALACGFKDSAKAIRKRVDQSGRCLCRVTFDGQARSATFLNLVGLKQFLDAVNTARARDIAAWLLNDDNLQQSLFDEPPKDNLPVIAVGNVRGYVDDKGTVHLNAEDVARGLGFVMVRADRVTTSGDNPGGRVATSCDNPGGRVTTSCDNPGGQSATSGRNAGQVTANGYNLSPAFGQSPYIAVRWRTVNEYLAEFDCPPVGKGDFIPENMFYLLAMKANNETAKAFQWKVANDILPSIRKQGFYVADDAPAHVRANLSLKSKEVALLKNQLPAEKMIDFAVVYMLLMSNGSVKIGMTANLTERARQIKAESGLGVLDYVSTPFIAREDAVRLEESLKQRFNDKCLGGEFFAIRFYDSRQLLHTPTSLTPAELARAF